MEVSGLEREGTSALLAGLAGGPLPDSLLDAWHARSGGNPFFLVELARLGQGDPDRVPPTVRDVVTRRLSLLPERARESLVTAAVIGHRFRPELVAAANGEDLDDVADDLDAARAADLVVDEEGGTAGLRPRPHPRRRLPLRAGAPQGAPARACGAGARVRSGRPPAGAGPGADRRAGAALAARRRQQLRPGLAGRTRGRRPGSHRVGARRGDAAAGGRRRGPPAVGRRGGPGALRPAAGAGDRCGVRGPLDPGRGGRERGDRARPSARLPGTGGRGGEHAEPLLRVDPPRHRRW